MDEVRYAISDDGKSRLGGEREFVFRAIENRYQVELLTRAPGLVIRGSSFDVRRAVGALDRLRLNLRKGGNLDRFLLESLLEEAEDTQNYASFSPLMRNRFGQTVQPRTEGQAELVRSVHNNDVVFVDGPAGTGKTFLAVALAVAALEEHSVERICLVRPAVEAGESLGFLPGDLKEKIAPYLRPIYDTLQELLPAEKLRHYHETAQIEIAPLAYMRGRTLKRAFIILDEAQNTTIAQMKMFLTRLGTRSRAVITGDATQIDLGPRQPSGLRHAMVLLQNVPGVGQVHFRASEVLRHRLVQEIIAAYESQEQKQHQ